eukprot:TRINITY_DN30357_c0_g1_i1.p1 TRINITY_DN30357_c0_g1~~TRINITY_DN30357_c0_g1_i1.p1  ORF type:complete len:234 (+),score=62.11 TRINITY_DN30357_c0_g1_i1:64-765(+)
MGQCTSSESVRRMSENKVHAAVPEKTAEVEVKDSKDDVLIKDMFASTKQAVKVFEGVLKEAGGGVEMEVIRGEGPLAPFVEEAAKAGVAIKDGVVRDMKNNFKEVTKRVSLVASASVSVQTQFTQAELVINLLQQTTETSTAFITLVSQGNIKSVDTAAYRNFTLQQHNICTDPVAALHRFKVLMFYTTEFLMERCAADKVLAVKDEADDEGNFFGSAGSTSSLETFYDVREQ